MYYKKYFSGTVDATTTTTQYYMGLNKTATGTAFRSGYVKNRSDVLGNAIVSTLKDIGYNNAYWDSTSGYVFMDKSNAICGFYLTVDSSYLYLSGGYKDEANNRVGCVNSAIGVRYNRFNANQFQTTGTGATDYKFYVTITGEPQGIFYISLGYYSSPENENTIIFELCLGTDKRDDSDLFGYNFATNNYSFCMCKYSDLTMLTEASYVALQANKLTLNNETVVLIPLFLQLGYIFIKNTYIQCGISKNGFYEIDGDTYHVQTYWMCKCITTI